MLEQKIKENEKAFLKDLERIHTTELGLKRIRQNLNLEVEDVVLWCKNAVKAAKTLVFNG